jgi:hypothetical protein
MFIRQHVGIIAVSLILCFAATILSSATAHSAVPQAEQATSSMKHHSVIPAPRISEWWFARQAEKIGLMSKGDIDLLMVGDSITNNFENEKVGLKVWEEYFGYCFVLSIGRRCNDGSERNWFSREDGLPRHKRCDHAQQCGKDPLIHE